VVAGSCLGTTCRKCSTSPGLYIFARVHCSASSLSADASTANKIFLPDCAAPARVLGEGERLMVLITELRYEVALVIFNP